MDSSINIEINTEKNDIQNLSKYRYKKSYNKNTSIYFLEILEMILMSYAKKINNYNNIFS